jgi:phospholipid N-methyltransferase
VELHAHLEFLKGYLHNPTLVGAITASSRALAAAVCEPFRRSPHAAKVLEVGAGTGAITRYLGSILGDQDELDVCEIDPRFVKVLRETVLARSEFEPALSAGRIRLVCAAVQDLPHDAGYDFIICGLPFSCFELADAQSAFTVMRRMLKPEGVLSYYEYVGFRKVSRLFSIGRRRRRTREVSRFLTQNIRRHQFEHRTVLQNFPPAHARHLRFD